MSPDPSNNFKSIPVARSAAAPLPALPERARVSESLWEAEQVNDRRHELLREQSATTVDRRPRDGPERGPGHLDDKDPPSELQALIDAVAVGHGLDLHCRN